MTAIDICNVNTFLYGKSLLSSSGPVSLHYYNGINPTRKFNHLISDIKFDLTLFSADLFS